MAEVEFKARVVDEGEYVENVLKDRVARGRAQAEKTVQRAILAWQ